VIKIVTFSEKLKKIRMSKGFSKADIARQLKIPYTTYRNYEEGREPKLETIKKIATALEVPYVDLLDDFPTKEVEQSFLSYADEIAKKRNIYDLFHRLQKLGFSLSLTLDENVHTSTLKIDGINIEVTDEELIALEKDSDDYLKFKLIELRNKKVHKK